LRRGFCCLWVGVQTGQLAIMGMRVWFSTKARWLTAFDLLIPYVWSEVHPFFTCPHSSKGEFGPVPILAARSAAVYRAEQF
jgi:hypothetical protein